MDNTHVSNPKVFERPPGNLEPHGEQNIDAASLEPYVRENVGEELPSLNSYVLEEVFRYLGLESIKRCRLVHPLWLDEASRSFFKQKCIRIFAKQGWNNETMSYEVTPVCLDSLTKVFQKWNNTRLSFSNLHTNWNLLTKKCSSSPEILNFIRNHGKCLRTLKMESFGFLRSNEFFWPEEIAEFVILLPQLLSYSPNLLSLQLAGGMPVSSLDFAEIYINFDLSTMQQFLAQNLKIVEIDGEYPVDILNLLVLLLKSSPKLEVLRIIGHGHGLKALPGGDVQQLQKVANFPQISRHLKELSWIVAESWFPTMDQLQLKKRSLEIISKMTLGPDLKILRLPTAEDSRGLILTENKGLHLLRIFHQVSGSLEVLILSGGLFFRDEEGFDGIINLSNEEGLPPMAKLKVLRVDSQNAYGLGSVSVFQKLPVLETAYLNFESGIKSASTHWTISIDDFLSDWRCFKSHPHQRLRRLYLVNKELTNIASLIGITESFPNLQQLYLGITTRRLNTILFGPTSSLTIGSVAHIMSELRHLQEFSIFDYGAHSSDDACDVIRQLQQFPRLEKFSMTSKKERKKGTLIEIDLFRSLTELWRAKHNINIKLCGYEVIGQLFSKTALSSKRRSSVNNFSSEDGQSHCDIYKTIISAVMLIQRFMSRSGCSEFRCEIMDGKLIHLILVFLYFCAIKPALTSLLLIILENS